MSTDIVLQPANFYKRIFRVSTILFFTSMVQSTWEVVLMYEEPLVYSRLLI
jgi:hypothetical protein